MTRQLSGKHLTYELICIFLVLKKIKVCSDLGLKIYIFLMSKEEKAQNICTLIRSSIISSSPIIYDSHLTRPNVFSTKRNHYLTLHDLWLNIISFVKYEIRAELLKAWLALTIG